MLQKFIKQFVVAGLAVLVVATSVSTVQASQDQIKFRKTVMKGIGASMGGLKAVVQGKAGMASAAGLASAIMGFSEAAASAFPKGSSGDKSRAKDEIWSKPAEFKAALMAFQKASANLASVAKGGDAGALKAAFGGVGKACGGCHKPFRKPKS